MLGTSLADTPVIGDIFAASKNPVSGTQCAQNTCAHLPSVVRCIAPPTYGHKTQFGLGAWPLVRRLKDRQGEQSHGPFGTRATP